MRPTAIVSWIPLALFAGALLALFALSQAPTAASPSGPGPRPAADRAEIAAACGGADPYLASTRFTEHLAGGDRSREAALIAFHGGEGDAPAAVAPLASQLELGATFGLAYDAAHHALFAAAYHKRATDFGPSGPGGIYRVDLASGTVSPFAQLPAGPDRHDLRNRDDSPAGRWVGLASLGGLAVDEGGATLYAMNLLDRRVYRIVVADGRSAGSFPAALGGDRGTRPFALAWHEGWLYQGLVDSDGDTSSGGQPVGYVYRTRPNGSGEAEVARFVVNFAKAWPWGPWDDAFAFGRSQPMLVSLAFRPSGELLVGLRDRVLDGGWPPTLQLGSVGGDLLLGTPAGASFTVRSLNRAGGLPWGGLASLPWLDWTVATGARAPGSAEGAARWVDERTGLVLRTVTVSGPPPLPGAEPAWGLGGLALLCGAAPSPAPGLEATLTALATELPRTATAGASATQGKATELATLAAPTLTAAAATRNAQLTAQATQLAAQWTRVAMTQRAQATDQMATRVSNYRTVAPTRTAEAQGTMTARPGTATAAAPTLVAAQTAAARTATVSAPRTQTPAAARWREIQAACAGDNPYYAAAIFRKPSTPRPGSPTPRGATATPFRLESEPAILAFNDSDPESPALHLSLATQGEVGAVFGLAYDGRRGQLYAGAFNKRGAPFGPEGPGAVYRLDLATGALRTFAQLPAGFDWHAMHTVLDEPAADWVGKMSLGDLELDAATDTLFATNLLDRRIWRYRVPDGAPLGSFPHGAAAEPWAANARPFGLGVWEGWLYHGVVDSREDPDLPGRLAAYVYRSRPDGGQMRLVAELDLAYPRAFPWRAWPPIPPASFDMGGGNFVDAEPLLSDLEFRPDGDLLLGLRSRLGDAATGNAEDGDLLPTRRLGPDSWLVVPEPEHYADRVIHDESSWGTLARVPKGLDQVLSTAIDPWVAWSGGGLWFDNPSGQYVRRETLYVGAPMMVPGSFGKTAGLGDVEALCPPEAATPTPAVSPSATATGSPTASATPSATRSVTPSPSPTATPVPLPIYIPVILDEACEERAQRADVVLVIDVSTSMQRLTHTGRQKLAAVQDAARLFTGRMDFLPTASGKLDQVAIAGFNDSAWLQQPLSSDRTRVEAAIDALPGRMAEGTRLDLALAIGRQALSGPERRPDNNAVVVLLTDGLPNRVPLGPDGRQETTVLSIAAELKAAGLRLYTIGVGQPGDYDAALLGAVASRQDMFYETADAEELARIYGQIAYTIACPGGRHDWGKPWP